jgi:solute:Na+ symporter, SSS family
MTDLEFYELRYSGKAASVVRGFRAVYLGLFFNCFIMGMVTLAACKIANILFGLPQWQTILICGALNVVFAAHSGLWGVLVIDMVQFFIKMTAVIAAAYFGLKEVARHMGVAGGALAGLHKLVSTLGSQQVVFREGTPVMSAIDGSGQPILNIMPNFSMWELALMIFIVPIAIGWWANWYPGAEPGGGSYIAQRMLASKSEKDSLGSTLFFNLAHYVLRPWPWIITALCSIIIFPELKDIQAAFPGADPKLIGHDSAFPAMLKFLPVGFVGLMVGGLIAANSSTILTHLNWGSSYLVHDFYRRFVSPDADEKHYVNAGRICTVLLYIAAALLSLVLSSAQDAFEILISIGAGTGLLYLLRWFWWRINAWTEIAAMAGSFLVSLGIFLLGRSGHEVDAATALLVTVGITTVIWLIVTFVTQPTDMRTLVAFYERVRPAGPGWAPVRAKTNAVSPDSLTLSLAGWVLGLLAIYSALFGAGAYLYGNWSAAIAMTLVFIVSGALLVTVISRIWTRAQHVEDIAAPPITADA